MFKSKTGLKAKMREILVRLKTGIRHFDEMGEDTRAYLFVGMIVVVLLSFTILYFVISSWYRLAFAAFALCAILVSLHIRRRDEIATSHNLCPACAELVKSEATHCPSCAAPVGDPAALEEFLVEKQQDDSTRRLSALEHEVRVQGSRLRRAEREADRLRKVAVKRRLREASSPDRPSGAGPKRSLAAALILTLVFGPFGLTYVSFGGFLIVCVFCFPVALAMNLISEIPTIQARLASFGEPIVSYGWLIGTAAVMWLVSLLWAAAAAGRRNE